jgi:beta-aspartyl-peptidase (threonine type)
MKYKGLTLDEAVHHLIFDVLDEDTGALIAVGSDGSISMQTNTGGLSRGAADSTGRFEVKLGK